MRCWLLCRHCDNDFDLGPYFNGCPQCGGVLEVAYDYSSLPQAVAASLVSRTNRRHCPELLPLTDGEHLVTLGEGNTPLIESRRLSHQLGLAHCYLKNESVNPTWGHKDRAQSIMLTKAEEFGFASIAVASTGNHGASAAAYAARANRRSCAVFCPLETPDILLRLIDSFGGLPFVADWQVRHEFVAHLVTERGWYPATGMGPGSASNPYGVEGYKSLAYELVRDLGRVPDHMYMACAVGESLYGVYKGFKELMRLGLTDRVPRMNACQPAGANVLEQSIAAGLSECVTLEHPSSVATSVREPTSGEHALQAIYESGGHALAIDDEQTLDLMRIIGMEGICIEPASAVAAAGLVHDRRLGRIADDDYVVAVLTSSGIKWPCELNLVTGGGIALEPTLAALQTALSARGLIDA